MKRALIFAFSLALLVACEKDPEIPDLSGTWNWIETETGWGGGTPETLGYTMKIIFTDVMYTEYFNGWVEHSGAYYLTPEEEGSSSYILLIDDYPQPLYLSMVSNDKLRLSDGMVSPSVRTYVRARTIPE